MKNSVLGKKKLIRKKNPYKATWVLESKKSLALYSNKAKKKKKNKTFLTFFRSKYGSECGSNTKSFFLTSQGHNWKWLMSSIKKKLVCSSYYRSNKNTVVGFIWECDSQNINHFQLWPCEVHPTPPPGLAGPLL